MTQQLLGRRSFCLVFGASRGIGRAIAERFGSQLGDGSTLLLAGRDVGALDGVARAVRAAQGDRLLVRTSRLDAQTADEAAIAAALEHGGAPDAAAFELAIVVHNAASVDPMDRRLHEHTRPADIAAYFHVNLVAAIALNNVFLARFGATPSKLVVHMSSASAVLPSPSLGLYCTGKAARDMFFKCLAVEQPHVRIISYAPGTVDTDMVRAVRDTSWSAQMSQAFQAGYRGEGVRILTTDETVDRLFDILRENSFDNGAHVDYEDLQTYYKALMT